MSTDKSNLSAANILRTYEDKPVAKPSGHKAGRKSRKVPAPDYSGMRTTASLRPIINASHKPRHNVGIVSVCVDGPRPHAKSPMARQMIQKARILQDMVTPRSVTGKAAQIKRQHTILLEQMSAVTANAGKIRRRLDKAIQEGDAIKIEKLSSLLATKQRQARIIAAEIEERGQNTIAVRQELPPVKPRRHITWAAGEREAVMAAYEAAKKAK